MTTERSTAPRAKAENAPITGGDDKTAAVPIYFLSSASELPSLGLDSQRNVAWLEASGFKPRQRKHLLLPDGNGGLAAVLLGHTGSEKGQPADPMARRELQLGNLPALLPPGQYRLASSVADSELAAVAWGLGGYRFRRYKNDSASSSDGLPQLQCPDGVDLARVLAIVDGVRRGRDLINTPANDLGPAEIGAAVEDLAAEHGAMVRVVVGDDLLIQNYPLIHAVGRASTRAPRLIDMTWTSSSAGASAPLVTLVGKGIAFDTGGLDLKPASGMLIMKKDMGGAATAIGLAHMIMQTDLPVRLRLIIAAAENSVSGDAFRPLDVIKSRAGITVEIGNTDAEGRLVLADALALADEDAPDILMTFATLTGAARVALGPELVPYFTDDEHLAADLAAAGIASADPLWRLPFWTSYESGLESPVADLSNVADGPFAGSIVAAVFLRKFVKQARRFAHFDLYGWRPSTKPLGPKGGEVTGARAVFRMLEQMVGS